MIELGLIEAYTITRQYRVIKRPSSTCSGRTKAPTNLSSRIRSKLHAPKRHDAWSKMELISYVAYVSFAFLCIECLFSVILSQSMEYLMLSRYHYTIMSPLLTDIAVKFVSPFLGENLLVVYFDFFAVKRGLRNPYLYRSVMSNVC